MTLIRHSTSCDRTKTHTRRKQISCDRKASQIDNQIMGVKWTLWSPWRIPKPFSSHPPLVLFSSQLMLTTFPGCQYLLFIKNAGTKEFIPRFRPFPECEAYYSSLCSILLLLLLPFFVPCIHLMHHWGSSSQSLFRLCHYEMLDNARWNVTHNAFWLSISLQIENSFNRHNFDTWLFIYQRDARTIGIVPSLSWWMLRMPQL